MKNYAKVGNRNGMPAYRTPVFFRNKKTFVAKNKYVLRNINKIK